MPLTAGTRLGSYVIEAALGAGGMGEVYRARDTKGRNRRALQCVSPPILGGAPQPIGRDVDSVVAVSPDGSRLAFVRGAPREGETRVYIVSSDGSGEPRQLAASPTFTGYALYSGIAWSPDGGSLVVPVGGVTPIGGVSEASLVVVDAASGKERPLTSKRRASVQFRLVSRRTVGRITWPGAH